MKNKNMNKPDFYLNQHKENEKNYCNSHNRQNLCLNLEQIDHLKEKTPFKNSSKNLGDL